MFLHEIRHPERNRTSLGGRHRDGRHVHRRGVVIDGEEVRRLGPGLELVRLRV